MKEYILYWMQQAQRVNYNQALNYSIQLANSKKLPLLVCFIITPFPEAQPAHYRFMLQGIQEVESALKAKNINFIIRIGNVTEEVINLSVKAETLIMDRGYLRIQREWRKSIQKIVKCPTRIIDTDTIIPVMQVSDKQEIAARTIRPRIRRLLDKYLTEIPDICVEYNDLSHNLVKEFKQNQEVYKTYSLNNIDHPQYHVGGYSQAKSKLAYFISEKLSKYHLSSNDPSLDNVSRLSPYLHFGQVSSLEIALEVMKSKTAQEAKDAYLEQLIVRRELAVNFIWFAPDYDKYQHAVPHWAQSSLELHKKDQREHLYSLEEFEQAKTHDPYWNAAQNELLITGIMHNYMRMYWGKKIMEWTESPQQAYDWMCWLNNKYQLDGRDANSYAGIAWCFGLHDHPWKERAVFGKIRYMNAKGLERKFNIKKYAETWNHKKY
ncbi:MAG: deoxyribodipyrimidine photo-lyase [Candidatus Stygibacter australis]|nr:deoxyribodipyrimidine photo-lyase [Candidatus Stygibacter australis]MDP8321037.1 deoxyribodipyrimidine photo-lyase [Candidatus Stygibacter australis]